MYKLSVQTLERAKLPTLEVGSVSFAVPAVVAAAGERAARRFVEFFTATIRNKNTRLAYARAVSAFLSWCEEHGLAFDDIESVTVATYIEQLLADGMAKPSVKQHLAAIRMMLDWMVTGGFLPYNPAAAVRGPKYVIRKGKTPVLTPDEARLLLDSIRTVKIVTRKDGAEIEKPDLAGLRDRALLAVMVYSLARVSAVVGMDVDDYYQQGKRWWLRLMRKSVLIQNARAAARRRSPFAHNRQSRRTHADESSSLPAKNQPSFWRTHPSASRNHKRSRAHAA